MSRFDQDVLCQTITDAADGPGVDHRCEEEEAAEKPAHPLRPAAVKRHWGLGCLAPRAGPAAGSATGPAVDGPPFWPDDLTGLWNDGRDGGVIEHDDFGSDSNRVSDRVSDGWSDSFSDNDEWSSYESDGSE